MAREPKPWLVSCEGCGAVVSREGIPPENAYIGASPGCWLLFTEVRGREMSDLRYLAHARSTTDVYMVQHPGVPGRQSSQSVWVHLVGLYLVLERGLPVPDAIAGMRRVLSGRPEFPWLEPPPNVGPTTVVDAHAALDRGPSAYIDVVRRWADDAWQAWSPHHAAIAELVARRSDSPGS